ncbi:hypothetical protein [Aneurinibacillus thermoaerophilus]|uniref:AAA family ATPase n=1 Tax=Aneurinibacillus thermoaerophilus TaxID=143495 RepID=UPI002E20EFF0|nr:hypothetical protein [Aneurinibacillus thermoaerophilus]
MANTQIPRVLLAMQPEFTEELRPVIEENGIVVTATTADTTNIVMLAKATQAQVVLLSSYLFYAPDASEQERIIEVLMSQLRQEHIRTILFCPDREMLINFLNRGYLDFVYLESGEVDVSDILSMIYRPRTLDKAREAVGLGPQEGAVEEHIVRITPRAHIPRRFYEEEEEEVEPLVISFFSPNPGVGVSTLSHATAYEMARRGLRTCLVEWDIFNPTCAISTGLSHSQRNLQNWLEKNSNKEQYTTVKDYIINSKIWEQEIEKDKKGFLPVIRELPENLFILAATEHMDLFALDKIELKPNMPHFVISDLIGNMGFDAVVLDVPSQLLFPVTGTSLKLSSKVFLVTNGNLPNCMHIKRRRSRLEKDLGAERISLVYNSHVEHEGAISAIERVTGLKVAHTVDYDEYSLVNSHNFEIMSNMSFTKGIKSICDALGVVDETEEEKSGWGFSLFKKKEKQAISSEKKVKKTEKKEEAKGLQAFLGVSR